MSAAGQWPTRRRTMCTECGLILAYIGTFVDSRSVAADHVLDDHRDHSDPGSIVFCDYYGGDSQ